MKLKDLKKDFITKLAITYPNKEILSIFKILCEEYMNMSPTKLLLAGEELISSKQIDMFSKAIIKLLSEEPYTVYIKRQHHFMDLNLFVVLQR
jgi:predicted NACHT family NTPase